MRIIFAVTRRVFFAAVILSFYGEALSAAELIFDGRYEYRSDEESLEILGKQVCFYPSESTSALVPRPAGDHRLPWFCFKNSEKAAGMLGFKLVTQSKTCGIRGSAKVIVIDYRRYKGEGDDNDVATLKSVVDKSQPMALPCSN